MIATDHFMPLNNNIFICHYYFDYLTGVVQITVFEQF